MKITPIESSNLAEVGYEGSTKTLRVVFKGGGAHEYVGVEKGVYDGLLGAESKGGYFHRVVRGGGYENRKVG